MSRPKPTPSISKPVPARAGATGQAARVRIVVADSQAIDRGGIVRLLEGERDFTVVGEAASVDETTDQCRSLEPDVLVLSLNLAGQATGPAIPAIRSVLPNLRILALSERGAANCLVLNPPSRAITPGPPMPVCVLGIDCLQLAVAQGAMATVRRSADPEELYRAVRAVAEGRAWYDPTTATGMLSSTGPGGSADPGARLSGRELEVAALVAEGRSNKEISTLLGIGEPTVKKHVGHLLEKLGVQDRLQLGLFVARNPLILVRR